MAFHSSLFERRLTAIRTVLGQRTFRLFSLGNFMSLTAIWIVRVCVAWLTWELTRSKTWLGVVAFAELGPSVIVSLYAGPLADRIDKIAILRMGQWLQVVLALLIAMLSLSGRLDIWWLMTIMIGYSIIGGLTLPARMSLAPMLVEKQHLATASGLGSATLNVTRLLGPLIAAPMIVASSEGWAFFIAAAGFLANAASLTAIGTTTNTVPNGGPAKGQEGYGAMLRFLTRDRRIAALLVLQFFLWLSLRPLTDMLPAFADQVFRSGEQGYAMLTASMGMGALLGAFYLMGQEEEGGMRRLVLGGAVTAGVAMIAFALAPTLPIAIGIVAIYGAAVTAAGAAATTFIQMQAPRDQLGRIMSIYSLIFRFAPAAGALVFGLAAEAVGLAPMTMAFALVGILCTAFYQQRTGALEKPAE